MFSRLISPRLPGIAQQALFKHGKNLYRLAGSLRQVDRVPWVGRLPCLACKCFNVFSKETYEPSQGSSASRVAQLAGAPSLHVNRPLVSQAKVWPVYYKHYVKASVICIQDLLFSLNSTDSYNQLSKKICKTNILDWAGLRRSIPLSLRSYDRYPSTNLPTFVVGDNNFDVTKGKSKDYYNLLLREKAKQPNIIQKLQSNFHFNSDNLKQIFKLPHSIVVKSYV